MSRSARFHLLALLIAALLPFAAFAAGDDSAVTLEQLRHQQRDAIIRAEARFPSLGLRDPADIFQFALTDTGLTAQTRIDPTSDSVRLQLKGMDGLAEMRVRAIPDPPPTAAAAHSAPLVWFHYNDFTEPGTLYTLTEIYLHPNGLQIAKSFQYPDKSCVVSFVTLEKPPSALLSIQTIAENSGQVIVDHRYPAGSLMQLRREHCHDVDLYLRPIIRQFNQESAIFPADDLAACQALASDAAPDPAIAAAAQAALARMNTDNFPQRQSASAQLVGLGMPGILYLLSLNPATLTPEQNVRVDEILRPYRVLPAPDVTRLRNDPDFLLDCLTTDDATLRNLATLRLSKILGHPIAMDDKLSPDQRLAQIQQFRDSLNPSPAPTTASAPAR